VDTHGSIVCDIAGVGKFDTTLHSASEVTTIRHYTNLFIIIIIIVIVYSECFQVPDTDVYLSMWQEAVRMNSLRWSLICRSAAKKSGQKIPAPAVHYDNSCLAASRPK